MRVIFFVLLFLGAFDSYAIDTVIINGRVIDPETDLDAIRNVAIDEGRITAISKRPLKGDRVIDARGMFVSPGFIDLHAHGQDETSNQFQAADGVTTALELEFGA